MATNSKQGTVQTRLSRCPEHGLVDGTRQLPKLRFPFIITGAIRLAAMAGAFRRPKCGTKTTKD